MARQHTFDWNFVYVEEYEWSHRCQPAATKNYNSNKHLH